MQLKLSHKINIAAIVTVLFLTSGAIANACSLHSVDVEGKAEIILSTGPRHFSGTGSSDGMVDLSSATTLIVHLAGQDEFGPAFLDVNFNGLATKRGRNIIANGYVYAVYASSGSLPLNLQGSGQFVLNTRTGLLDLTFKGSGPNNSSIASEIIIRNIRCRIQPVMGIKE